MNETDHTDSTRSVNQISGVGLMLSVLYDEETVCAVLGKKQRTLRKWEKAGWYRPFRDGLGSNARRLCTGQMIVDALEAIRVARDSQAEG